MSRSLVIPLVLKDWYIQRRTLQTAVIGGLVGIALVLVGGTIAVFGLAATLVCTIAFGVTLSQSTVMTEKNRQNEPFVMSLPITPLEYAAAKVIASVSMYIVVWFALMLAIFVIFLSRGLPGFLPPATIAAFAIFVGFCTILCVAIGFRSERLFHVTMMLTNFGYGAVWIAMVQIPNLAQQATGPVAVWSKHILWFLAAEFAVLIAAIALGVYGQSRRTSFL